MRISTPQLNRISLNTILEQQAQASRAQLEIASGKKILTPSDDPVGTVFTLAVERNLKQLEQFDRNANLLESRVAQQESELTSAINVTQRVREVVVSGNTATQSAETRNILGAELRQQLGSLLQRVNAKDADGNFLFSGNAEKTPAVEVIAGRYEFDLNNTPSGAAPVVGKGEVRQVQIGPSTFLQDTVSAREIFGFGADPAPPAAQENLFARVERAITLLTDPSVSAADRSTGLGDTLTALDEALSRFNVARTDLGIRRNQIAEQLDLNGAAALQVETVLSSRRDVDYAEAVTRFNQRLLGLQAAQQAYSKVQGLSLFNYL